jgi:predicted DNA-binding transcriptional regulator YafY
VFVTVADKTVFGNRSCLYDDVRIEVIVDVLSVLSAARIEYDAETFHTLTEAMIRRRRLELRYWSASRNETTRRLFDPYEISAVDDG